MFSFAKKDASCKLNQLNGFNSELPEGCEALAECDFADVSGAVISEVMVHL